MASGVRPALAEIAQEASDRPVVTSKHQALQTAQEIDKDEVMITTGFKQRPIRDGGGKPSGGRLRPERRRRSNLAAVGAALLTASTKAGMLQQAFESVSTMQKEQPLEEHQLETLRNTICKHLPGAGYKVTEGQPFYLHLISDMAHLGNDPDGIPSNDQRGSAIGNR